MSISRVTDAQTFALLTERAGRLQVTIQTLQDQVASGKRLLEPQQDPLGAAQVIRHGTDLAALAQYAETSRFGSNVLGLQDDILGDAKALMIRAEEIATAQASSLNRDQHQVAALEVHGLLQTLTVAANTEFAGRSVYSGLALNAPSPFADPDDPGYSAATAFSGSTQELEIKIGATANERVRLSSRGDQVFGDALTALQALETALNTDGDIAATLPALAQGRNTLADERASVGARQAQLQERTTQVAGLTIREQAALASIRDADAVAVISQLTQAQNAFEAVLAAGARVAQTSLVDLLRI